jgi:peroxiredoxin
MTQAMRADIVPGATFPDYELVDHTGSKKSLNQLQGNDPVAVALARGGYCPKEHLQHVWMAAL